MSDRHSNSKIVDNLYAYLSRYFSSTHTNRVVITRADAIVAGGGSDWWPGSLEESAVEMERTLEIDGALAAFLTIQFNSGVRIELEN
jgi:hypothetical protein